MELISIEMIKGVFFKADLAGEWMDLAELVLNAGKKESAAKYMAIARDFIEKEPGETYGNDVREAWKEAVTRYNSKVEFYQNKGIEIERIEIR